MKSKKETPKRGRRRVLSSLALCTTTTLAVVGLSAAAPAIASGGSVSTGGVFVPLPGSVPSGAAAFGTKKLKSLNWSGYAQSGAGGTFTAVQDTWHVPTVTPKPGDQYSSDWVGIGGFIDDTTLVQAGTEADNIGGVLLYRAWTEILPAPEDPLTLVISPGDEITTLVEETSANTWLMQVSDVTTGQTQSRSVAYDSSGASVEAIHERPCLAPCTGPADFAVLSTTTNVTFDPGEYSSSPPGAPVFNPLLSGAGGATLYDLIMAKGKTVFATPSASDSDHDGFTVADGKHAPPPPAS
ncbi:MAG TPA: G1 family glutamic endopeptidase [Acidimicrobiales bacterium]|nr:G1 family glutamic endopeptidase [Acidimicrobiales bacterium]